MGPAQAYAVFEFTTDADLDHERLPGGRCRWSFEMPEFATGRFPKRAKDRSPHSEWGYLPELSGESIGTLLEERAPWFDGGVERFSWRTLVRFEHRLAPRFGTGHIWLVGDAAHLTGPAGVRSMNMGFLEGHDLASAITRILNEAAPLQHPEGFNESWTRTWRQLLGLDSGFEATPEADNWVSQNADRLLQCLPGHGSEMGFLAGQLGLYGLEKTHTAC